jgi:large conductance mechanosensitive channel
MVDAVKALNKVNPLDFAKQFRDFLLKTNMLSLALAVVIGAAANDVVNSIVKDVLGTVFDVLVPRAGWDALNVNVWRFQFRFGNFVQILIKFIIVSGVVFLITKAFIRSSPPAPTKPCPACKEANHPEATRCKFCTSELPLAVAPPAAPPAA